jgi:ABC-2 type transport system permease protein
LTSFIPIAMTIQGTTGADTKPAAGDEQQAAADTGGGELKVVYVCDADMMLPDFSMIRADPDTVTEARFQFQNVTFVLNCVDWLTGETDFIEVRKHEPIFASLRMIDAVKEEARTAVRNRSQQYQDEYDQVMRQAQESVDRQLRKLREEVEKLQKESADGSVPRSELQAKLQRFQTLQELEQRKLNVKRTKSTRDRELRIREIERKAADEVTTIQNKVKAAAVALPCIPPLIVGVIVFTSRRLRERENISKSRLK